MDQYTTVQGDTFDQVAKQVYGKEFFAERLIKANPEHRNTVIFSSGITLNVPEVIEEEINFDTLPPWRREE